ncbi:MAG: TonB-dependent receptor [Bdellovibrionaceae bacterium]|nr:TonB-dependent receptor [Pseudobdellovibrionaceae bacterium]
MTKSLFLSLWVALAAPLAAPLMALAQDVAPELSATPTPNPTPVEEASAETQLSTIRVTGMQAEELSQPAAPKRISKETLEEARLTDVGRALRQAPGVYVRDEEGQGLRPNIGLRGTNPDRSKKIVIMQDEILIGPAPYSAPAAYYTPSLNLAEELQIFKGYSAMLYGPNSIGGAINYNTRAIPVTPKSSIDFGYGSFGTSNTKLYTGGGTSWGGYLVEASHMGSNGFKEIDGGGPTGFQRGDVQGKFRFDLPTVDDRVQFVELRLGYGYERSHETYLGLTDDDFDASPYRRYASSALDEMNWNHYLVQLEYNRQIGEAGLLKVAAYRHDYARDWYRIDRFGDATKNLKSVLQNPTGADALFAGILRGTEDSSSVGGTQGQVIYANNDRKFVSQGVQAIWTGDLVGYGPNHSFKTIARVHQDQIDRNHTYDTFDMVGGRLNRVTAGNIDKLNQDWALASSLGFQDDISWDDWVFSVMGRYESIIFNARDKVAGTDRRRGDSYFVPGVGLLRKIGPTLSLKASLNSAVTASGLDPNGAEAREESVNLEAGVKYLSESRTTEADLVYFQNNYSNITGTCTASTGCAAGQLDTQFNGGAAIIRGIEARVGHNLRAWGAWFPVQLNVTYIQGRFANEFTSANAEWGVGTVRSGDPLPYVPEMQYTFIVGHEQGRFKQALNFTYQGEMFDQSVEAGRQSIPSYGIVDWNGLYTWSESFQVFAKADNVLGRKYLVAERPFGARPGKPQSFMAGLKYSF